ncbi:MAG: DUF3244 domain-containing protein [Bacteroidales bacterium]|nr:DUF3244 domain-containing protein [Bacteroidales bacterium]
MRNKQLKSLLLWIVLLLPITWCGASSIGIVDGFSHITVKVGDVQGVPRTSAIQATIEGHVLSVVFLENLGQVSVEVVSAMGWEVTTRVTPTPNGVDIYITNTGSYIVYFTLPNGDVYYGEFEVTD